MAAVIAWKARKRPCGRYPRLIRASKITRFECIAIAYGLAKPWAIARAIETRAR